LLTVTGIASLLLAPFGAHGVNLAAITAAICTGPHAHEDPQKRYTATIYCGLFYAWAGLFGARLVALFAALPSALLMSVAAIALLGSIGNGLSAALHNPNEREAALLTFMLCASGISFYGIGSAFWGLLAGVLTLLIVNAGRSH
jgi:benzoate membrane transport protein